MSENFREPRPIEPQVDPSMHAPTEQQDSNDPPRGIRTMAVFRWILIGAMGVIAVLSVAYSAGLISTGSASAAP